MNTTLNQTRRAASLGFALALVCLWSGPPAQAQVPGLINYQGRVAVAGVNFNGSGQFKFALVNGTGTTTYWSNDGTSTAGSEPTKAVTLTVTAGLYSVLLGDTILPNMTTILPSVFANPDVRLRVWFNDGTNGSRALSPDQRIGAVGYALVAATVPDAAITSAKLADAAVTSTKLAAGAVGPNQMSPGAAVANLAGSGQAGVASGGMVLAATESAALVGAGYVRIGTTQMTGAWQQRVNGIPPAERSHPSAVWTGSEMIVWGGAGAGGLFASGGRYNPVGNTWTATSTHTAPAGRYTHTAVWTGSEMIVWGGNGNAGVLNETWSYTPGRTLYLYLKP